MWFIKFNYHSLSLFSRNEINDAIECLSTNLVFLRCVITSLSTLCTISIINNNNN